MRALRGAMALLVLTGMAVAANAVDSEDMTPEQRAMFERGGAAAAGAEQEKARPKMSELVKRAGEAIMNAEEISTIDLQSVEEGVKAQEARASGIVEAATPKDLPDLKQLFAGMPWAQEAEQIVQAELEKVPEERPLRYLVLATRALGPARMKEILRLSRERGDYAVVFRGPSPGQTIQDMVLEMSTLMQLQEGEDAPHVVMDPTRFEGDAPEAPVLMKLDEEGEVIAKVAGVINPEWLDARVERGERGDLGRYGEVSKVIEPDMIKLLQERLAAYEMEKKTREAYLGYFERIRLPELEPATEDRERLWDPSVILQDAITMPDGGVAAYPGTVLNPMKAVGFNMTLVFFDATDEAQVAWAREQIAMRDGQKVYAIATALDGRKGWQGMGELMTAVNSRVFHSNQMLVDRFGVQRVPCLVSDGSDYKLLIKEFSVDRLRKKYASTQEHGGSQNGTGAG